MVTKHVNRRTAVATLVGAVLTAGATWRFGSEAGGSSAVAQWPPAYVPPTTWAGLPSANEQKFLAWDQAIWNLEINGQQHQAVFFVTSLMDGPGDDNLKRNLSFFIESSQRHYLIAGTMEALAPAKSNPATRYFVLSNILRTVELQGAAVIPSETQVQLRKLFDSGIEQDPKANAALQRIISKL